MMQLEWKIEQYRGKENHGRDWVPAAGRRDAAAGTVVSEGFMFGVRASLN